MGGGERGSLDTLNYWLASVSGTWSNFYYLKVRERERKKQCSNFQPKGWGLNNFSHWIKFKWMTIGDRGKRVFWCHPMSQAQRVASDERPRAQFWKARGVGASSRTARSFRIIVMELWRRERRGLEWGTEKEREWREGTQSSRQGQEAGPRAPGPGALRWRGGHDLEQAETCCSEINERILYHTHARFDS